ncbi:hypothetical protein KY290_010766 [Solanum tuberosum]|uniref:Transmembrane protein n=1 Tax=Solanum tuberosum TaxID=4113 RepID=A0ABQ7VYS1_SOLTU|nr:hypothetical protein KY290_010766 [Solanum tuberosum]
MAATLFLVFLCFSQVIYLNAIPITRCNSLVYKTQQHENTQMENMEVESMKLGDAVIRRMEVEVNDYPGSGANNRHTPGHP